MYSVLLFVASLVYVSMIVDGYKWVHIVVMYNDVTLKYKER